MIGLCIASPSFDGYEFLAGASDQYLETTDVVERIHGAQPNILKCLTVTGLRRLLFIEQRKVKDAYPGRSNWCFRGSSS